MRCKVLMSREEFEGSKSVEGGTKMLEQEYTQERPAGLGGNADNAVAGRAPNAVEQANCLLLALCI